MVDLELGPILRCGCGRLVFYAATESNKRVLVEAVPEYRGALVAFREDGRVRAYHAANAPDVSADRYVLHRGCSRLRWPDPVAE